MKKLNHFPSQELEREFSVILSLTVPLDAENTSSDKGTLKLKNAVEDARKRVQELTDSSVASVLETQLDTIYQHERELVSHRGGLAIYVSTDEVYYYHLGLPTPSNVVMGAYPYVHPLIEAYQFTNDFHVLVLNGENFEIYRGNSSGIDKIEIEDEDAPTTLENALGDELDGGELTHGTFGGPRGSSGGQSFHGHNETSQEKEIDRRNYFRQVSRYVNDHYSKEENLPLIVYALTENASLFRELTNNKYLSDYQIEKSGSGISKQEIESEVLELLMKIRQDEQSALVKRFRETSPEFRIENIKEDLAVSAIQGRIEELAIKKGYQTKGRISESGQVDETADVDFVEELIYKTLQSKGQVEIISDDLMPEEFNIVARLRY